MPDDHPASVFAQYWWAFCTGPLFAALFTLSFTYPFECITKSGLRVYGYSPEPLTDKCTNVWGSSLSSPSEESAALIGVAVGGVVFVVCWVIASSASKG